MFIRKRRDQTFLVLEKIILFLLLEFYFIFRLRVKNDQILFFLIKNVSKVTDSLGLCENFQILVSINRFQSFNLKQKAVKHDKMVCF